MQNIVASMVHQTGSVKLEIECNFFKKTFPSRGFYICDASGRWYLHHDGFVKNGVIADSEKPAFWPTDKEAQDFFESWKNSGT